MYHSVTTFVVVCEWSKEDIKWGKNCHEHLS